MTNKKLITVFGATGAQGGSLARAILRDANSAFAVRAVTRHPESEKAQELARLGAEVVAANLDDAASVQLAMEGCYGAFCVTFFWEHFSPELETTQARGLAEAAKAAGVQHVIWSTLEDTRRLVPVDDNRLPTLMGKYKVPHMDAKGEADHYFRELGVPTTFLLTSFFWENFINFGMGPAPTSGGPLGIMFPLGNQVKVGMAAEDVGKCAYGIFKQPALINQTVGIAGDALTMNQMATSFSYALGREVRYHAVSPEVYRSFGFPGADELANMFQYERDFGTELIGQRDVAFSRKLNPELQTFESWLTENAARLV